MATETTPFKTRLREALTGPAQAETPLAQQTAVPQVNLDAQRLGRPQAGSMNERLMTAFGGGA